MGAHGGHGAHPVGRITVKHPATGRLVVGQFPARSLPIPMHSNSSTFRMVVSCVLSENSAVYLASYMMSRVSNYVPGCGGPLWFSAAAPATICRTILSGLRKWRREQIDPPKRRITFWTCSRTVRNWRRSSEHRPTTGRLNLARRRGRGAYRESGCARPSSRPRGTRAATA